jgi:integrase
LAADTASLLSQVADEFHDTLSRHSLVTPRARRDSRETRAVSLGPFLEEYIEGRAKLAPNTVRNLRQSKRILCDYFGPDRDLRTITQGDADAIKEHLIRQEYAPSTIAGEIKRFRRFFRAAVRKQLIETNPFADVTAGKQTNRSRSAFMGRELATRVLDACPTNEWRLIFALCRFQGLRCPSEVLSFQWSDIRWSDCGEDVIIVRKYKTAERRVPIFPETRPLLLAAYEEAQEGEKFVIRGYRSGDSKLRTQFCRILAKAGIPVWTRPFHNLRASFETELANRFPLHVACEWTGNSEAVARDHYLQVTPEHIRQATQKATHDFVVPSGTEAPTETATAVTPGIPRDTAVLVPPRGVEPRFSD